MTELKPACLYCGAESFRAPLISLVFQDKPFWICAQHLPILIHKPEELADKLVGGEHLAVARDLDGHGS